MRTTAALVLIAILAGATIALRAEGPPESTLVHHDLHAHLDPESGKLAAVDGVTCPTGASRLLFLLHDGLEPRLDGNSGMKLKKLDRPPKAMDFGKTPDQFQLPAGVPVALYELTRPSKIKGPWNFKLLYGGVTRHPVQAAAAEYARGFSETPGTIEPQGAYLAGSSLWVPWFGEGLLTFRLTTALAGGWDSVSQGNRTARRLEGGEWVTTWDCPHPTEEIYLVAGPFTEYEHAAGAVTAMAYLRKPDPALAERYLTTTAAYLEMYQKLVGPFPYAKFALVENFWETGYGMPSFTLLGEKVIRFPFILHSSYPHELLHNYWGNGVYVDYAGGNWSEGLTAYLADHLIAEQRGQGEEYRRTTLQKYADYVNAQNDFPLVRFRSRHDAASEAIGYGKSMMVFHMLRQAVGDKTFAEILQTFYQHHRFTRATFQDFATAATAATVVRGQDQLGFFRVWTERAGAPELLVESAQAEPAGDGWRVRFRLRQAQVGGPFPLSVPVAVTVAGQAEAVVKTVWLPDAAEEFSVAVPGQPLRLDVDPQYDLFRRLDRREIPPALSQAFGAGKVMLVVPSGGPEALRAGYRQLAEEWAKDRPGQMEVRRDDELAALPAAGAVWLLGWENRFRPSLEEGLGPYGARLTAEGAVIGGQSCPAAGHSLVIAVRHPADAAGVLVWVGTDDPAALPGLGRKLPHYGKYSYLGFEGGEPANILKGQWPAVGSPLSVRLGETEAAMGKLPARPALAELPPPFSAAWMRDHLNALASPEREGRGWGSAGLAGAADYIAEQFRKSGLRPGGEAGGYFQTWTETGGPEKESTDLRNVIGVLPGSRGDWAGQSVVVCAHYDHLGRGWPDVHQGDEGKIHPGADDNASGVAVLLELARVMAAEEPPERSVVFVAFAGEEAGRRGSKHYLESPGAHPPEKIMGALNLDTVGRLGSGKILVLGGSSAREWVHIVMGCGYVTGVPAELVQQELDSSDQASFHEWGAPAVQLFTGPHADYHRSTDTPDKVDVPGLVKVAAFTREAVRYLAERAEPLTKVAPKPAAEKPESGSPAAGGPPPGAEGTPRRASLGTMPDFAFSGPGVRVASVTDGSPAAKAGLQAGDVIVELAGQPVADLKGYAAALRAHQPGEAVAVTFLRGEERRTVTVTLGAR